MRNSDFTAFLTDDFQQRLAEKCKSLGNSKIEIKCIPQNDVYDIVRVYRRHGKTVSSPIITLGKYNGYCIVPKKCFAYGQHHKEIERLIHFPLALSFSGMLAEDIKPEIIIGTKRILNSSGQISGNYWCFGFDTYNIPATGDYCRKYALQLREMLIELCKNKGDTIAKY